MKINRQELIAALEAVRPGLASKEIVEQSMSFVFRRGRVYTYNDVVAISHPCAKELAGAVQSKELHTLLTRSTDDEVDIEISDNEMLIAGKRTKAGISLQTDITLPLEEVIGKKQWIELPAGFTAAVKFVLFSASTDMTKPWSTGVHSDGARVETCDNFRLTRYTLSRRTNTKVKGDLLIPAAACAELVKYDPSHYVVDDNWIHFTNEKDVQFSCRVIVDTFPDLSPFIDRKWKYKIEFHEDTVAILDRASVFLLAEKNGHPSVNVKVTSGRMVISAKGTAGWFEETVRVKASKEGFEFTINPQALKDMLPLLKDCELSDDGSVLKFVGDNFIHCCATVVE